jgi:ribosomal protein S18 acetylase RimI-like enzyme
MHAPTLADAADENLATHASWAATRIPGSWVRIEPELVVVDSGLDCDTFNVICRSRMQPGDAAPRIAMAIDRFRRAHRPFSWWVGPGDRPADLGERLAGAGLARAESELAMACDLAALRDVDDAPDGLEVRRVRTAAELADFARLNASNWDPPDRNVIRFYAMAAPALLAPDAPLRFYLGYVGGEPVATSELTVGGGVVGLYNISTRAPFRRRGIGTALTLRPLLDARAEGHTTAVLQAAPDGIGVYRRVGFEPFGEITEYKPVATLPAG